MLTTYFKTPTALAKRIEGAIRVTVLGGFLFGSLMGFNAIQIFSLVLRPFSKESFRRVNRWCAATWWSWCVIASEKINGAKGFFTGDVPLPGENAVVISNHQQMPDVAGLLTLGRRSRRLGDLKWFVKDIFKYVPGMGWGLAFLDAVFLKRDWEKDRKLIKKTFRKFTEENVPLWLVFFPEGTRITPDKWELSREYAQSHGMKPLDYLLVPRTKGFVTSVRALSSQIQAVYDVTIGYPEGIPTLPQWFAGWPRSYHLHMRRFPIVDLPTDETKLASWLLERYEEKDELLRHFFEKGKFPG